jgi:hypothetical protein
MKKQENEIRLEHRLKYCPFCGGAADIVPTWDGLYRAECRKCRCSTESFCRPQPAAVSWNKRTSDWISVKDRMPEKSGDYLVFVEGMIENMMYSKRHSAWNATDLICDKKHEITTVTHWMPLPEPPETKGDE